MVNRGSSFADFVRFRPHTHALNNLCRPYGWQLIVYKLPDRELLHGNSHFQESTRILTFHIGKSPWIERTAAVHL